MKIHGRLRIALYALGLVLVGCGGVKQNEFNRAFSAYQAEMSGQFTQVEQRVSGAEQKSVTVAKEEATKAKAEAIATAERGNAETLEAMRAQAKTLEESTRQLAEAAVRKAAAEEAAKSMSQALTVAKAADQKAQDAQAQAQKALQTAEASTVVTTKSTGLAPVMVYFASGKATITADAQKKLQGVAAQFKKSPDAAIQIKGHADARPIRTREFRNNWELSEGRALAVKNYLVKQLGVPAANIRIIPYAEYAPVASQSSEEGRQQNRRVELNIIPSMNDVSLRSQ
jgi:chemotaxis protein MotB